MTNFKKILLAGTSIVAVSAFTTQASAVDYLAAGNPNAIAADPAAVVNFADDATVTLNDAVNLANAAGVTTATTNTGTFTFAGSSTVTGPMGTSALVLKAIGAGATAGADAVTITGNAFATTITNTGTDTAVTDSLDFGGTVTSTTFNLISAGATAAHAVTSTVTGNYTATTTNITAAATAGADATLTLNGTTNALGTATLTDGVAGLASLVFGGTTQAASGTIDGGAAGTGTLTSSGDTTFSGAVGATNALLAVNGGANGKTTTFSSTLAATTTTVTGTGEIQLDGASTTDIVFTTTGTADINASLTGTIDFTNTAGTVLLADGANVSSTINSTGGATGTLTVEGTSTITGAVGAAAGLAAVNMTGAAGKTATFSAAVDAAAITVGAGAAKFSGVVGATLAPTTITVGAGSATFDLASTFTAANIGAGSATFTGLATGAVNFTADGSATFAGDLAGAIDNTSGADGAGSVTFSAAVTTATTVGATNALKAVTISGTALNVATGNFVAPATLALGDNNTLAVTGTFATAAGDVISTVVTDGAGDSGNITVTGAGTITSGTVVTLSFAVDNTIAANDVVTVVTEGGGGLATGLVTVNALTPGFTWTDVSDANNIKLKAVAKTATSNTDLAYTALIAGNADADIAALNTAIAAAGTLTAKQELVESATPTVDGSATVSLLNAGSQVASVVDTRVASLRTGITPSGIAAGSGAYTANAWFQGFANSANQDKRKGIDGYDSTMGGVAFGYDSTGIIDGGVLGVAASFGSVSAESDNANTTSTDVRSYGISVYGNKPLQKDMFVEGQLGFAFNDIETQRHSVGGVAGTNANGDTTGTQFSGKLAVGRDYAINNGMMLTPSVSAAFTHLNTAGYTETGAGGLNMNVSSENFSALNLGLGVTASWESKNHDGSMLKPEFKLAYAYDAIGDNIETSAAYTGNAGTSFKTNGADPARHAINAGLGFTYTSTENWDVGMKYDYVYKENYDSHNGTLRVTTHF